MRPSNAAKIITASDDRDTPVFNLQSYAPIGGHHYTAIFASAVPDSRFTFDDYAEKVAGMFKGRIGLAPNSLFASDDGRLFRAILAPHSESRKYEPEKLVEQGFKATAANVFTDRDQSIWRLVGEGDDQQLLRVTPENYEKLLSARRSAMPLHASDAIGIQPKFGDYAYAYIPELHAFDFGVFGRSGKSAFIISRRYKKKFNVDTTQIMEAAAADPVLKTEMKRKWDALVDRAAAFKDYLEFIGMMYGKNSDYYRANEQAIMDARVQ